MRLFYLGVLCMVFISGKLNAQTFYLGNDLSYVNQMEDCGAIFKEKGVAKDVYQIFADHGTNLVRVRLWNNPTWQNALVQPSGVKAQYSDYADVLETIKRTKQAGMQVMLDVHFSDIWADPARQIVPAAWAAVASNETALSDSVYNYMAKILTNLNAEGVMPEVVKVGNETNSGIMTYGGMNTDYTGNTWLSSDWTRHAKLFNAAIKAIRDISKTTTIKPKIALHESGISKVKSWYQNIINYGVTDFDIMGFSYYYAWHKASIAEMGTIIKDMKTTFPAYDVMPVETGYLWTTDNYDAMGNIITTPDPNYLPVSPEKQLEYMVDYAREVKRAGGCGVIFWEPAWVSTPCKTAWGTGSSHDHVVFFDPVNTNFMDNGGGNWTNASYYTDVTTHKATFKVNVAGVTVPKKAYITGKFSGDSWKILPMTKESSNLYSFYTYLPANDSGAYYFLSDSSWTAREAVPTACAKYYNTDRGYKIGTKDTVYSFDFGTCSPAGSTTKVNVTFNVDMTGQDVTNGVYITGTMTGGSWKIIPMTAAGSNIYTYTFSMSPADSGAYYFMNKNAWGSRETVPAACAPWWGSDRGYKIGSKDTVYAFKWGSCDGITGISSPQTTYDNLVLYPNPNNGNFTLQASTQSGTLQVEILSISGKLLKKYSLKGKSIQENINCSELNAGIYLVKLLDKDKYYYRKLIID